jgi:nucleoside-diphosphate-sugar epimerase
VRPADDSKTILVSGGAGFLGSHLCERVLGDDDEGLCVDDFIYGDLSQAHSFCYVDDLIEGFVRLMGTPAAVTGPMNSTGSR